MTQSILTAGDSARARPICRRRLHPAVADQPAPLDNFKRNKRGYWSFWIFVSAVRAVAVRRIHRQRPAGPGLLQGRIALSR
jgi:hypothetical protein